MANLFLKKNPKSHLKRRKYFYFLRINKYYGENIESETLREYFIRFIKMLVFKKFFFYQS